MIDVACAADEAYLPHAAAMVHSLLTANPPAGVRMHLLHPPELEARSRRDLQSMVSGLGSSLVFHEVAAVTVAGLPEMGRISRVMWHRLALPVALPDASRVLYLDCDVLVRRPLAPLWELDLGGCAVGAVTNVFPPYLVHRPDALGIPRRAYFNSGVLLLDLDAWRTRGESERIAAIVRAEPERIVFPDQDALNLALWRDRLSLHPRWNCQNAILYFRTAEELLGGAVAADARADPAILHFEGGAWAKPWHYLNDHPFRQLYFDHRAQTPWPEVRIEGRTPANVLRRRLPPRTRAMLRAQRARVSGALRRARAASQ